MRGHHKPSHPWGYQVANCPAGPTPGMHSHWRGTEPPCASKKAAASDSSRREGRERRPHHKTPNSLHNRDCTLGCVQPAVSLTASRGDSTGLVQAPPYPWKQRRVASSAHLARIYWEPVQGDTEGTVCPPSRDVMFTDKGSTGGSVWPPPRNIIMGTITRCQAANYTSPTT